MSVQTFVFDGFTAEAMQFKGDFEALSQFAGGPADWDVDGMGFVVQTDRGPLTGMSGDWVVLYKDGTFEVLTDDVLSILSSGEALT